MEYGDLIQVVMPGTDIVRKGYFLGWHPNSGDMVVKLASTEAIRHLPETCVIAGDSSSTTSAS